MPTPTKGPRLGGGPAHERLLLANLATALFEHGRITTTSAKAKRLRPLAERLITFAKRGDLHARRQVLTVVRDKGVVHTLFTDIGPRFAERPGGYTRITKLGPRKGDNAPMAQIELVEGPTIAQAAVSEGERARGTRFLPRRGTTAGARTGAAGTAAATGAGTPAGTATPAGTGTPAGTATPAGTGTPAGTATPAGTGTPAGTAIDESGGQPETEPAGTGEPVDVPTEGDSDLAPRGDSAPGGGQQSDGVADEAGDQPAEDVTSAQTEAAGDVEQAEGDSVPDDSADGGAQRS